MLLAVLVFILVSTLAASSLVAVHKTQVQREKEEQLLFVGAQFKRAIASYHNTIPPGGTRAWPPTLEVLLNDNRFPTPIQHLRRLYPDPITGHPDWDLIQGNGGIVGVRSQSNLPTMKRSGFGKGFEDFEGKETYSDWIFSIR
ncbi:MAG: type secretion system protein [Ramlibacter sp.]|nr:type secretion system protein [Ramlibacter sp.]